MATLGSRIAECRKRKNITQEQLAEQMGVSTQAVSKWENDISCPDISLLPPLADYFSISIDELMRGENSRPVQLVPEGERKDVDNDDAQNASIKLGWRYSKDKPAGYSYKSCAGIWNSPGRIC